jgi:hypothetical protein
MVTNLHYEITSKEFTLLYALTDFCLVPDSCHLNHLETNLGQFGALVREPFIRVQGSDYHYLLCVLLRFPRRFPRDSVGPGDGRAASYLVRPHLVHSLTLHPIDRAPRYVFHWQPGPSDMPSFFPDQRAPV